MITQFLQQKAIFSPKLVSAKTKNEYKIYLKEILHSFSTMKMIQKTIKSQLQSNEDDCYGILKLFSAMVTPERITWQKWSISNHDKRTDIPVKVFQFRSNNVYSIIF